MPRTPRTPRSRPRPKKPKPESESEPFFAPTFAAMHRLDPEAFHLMVAEMLAVSAQPLFVQSPKDHATSIKNLEEMFRTRGVDPRARPAAETIEGAAELPPRARLRWAMLVTWLQEIEAQEAIPPALISLSLQQMFLGYLAACRLYESEAPA